MMVAEKRIYSTTALQNCYRALRSARWSVRRKDEHMTRCCEVRELYAKCQVNLGCVLFDPDMSPAKDYLDMVKGKKVTKRQLDIQLRNCKQYLLYQFDELEKSVAGIPTEKTSRLRKQLLSVLRRTASFLLIFLAKNQVINARNVIGTNNARRRSILIRHLELFRFIRYDNTCVFPVVAFQELCIAHTEHFLDRQALQLHRVGAGCYCRCIVCHYIPARQS